MSNRYGLEIRTAAGVDAPGLSDLMTACGMAVSAQDFAERLQAAQRENGAVLVALAWGSPSGFVAVHWHAVLTAARPVAEIATLLVGPDDRRNGIGRALLKAAAQAARLAGCGTLRLSVPPDADALRAFCVVNGFVEQDAGFARALRKGGRPGG